MKRLLLLTFLCCLLTGLARAATVSGTVTNAVTNAPVTGQKIYVRDSFNTYKDSVVTNYNGFYTITLPASLSSGFLFLTAPACGLTNNKQTFYTGSNSPTVNFAICAGTPSYNLHGTVSLSGGANNGIATLYLIRKQYDSLLLDTTLIAIDSFTTAGTGGTFSKTYSTATLPSMAYGSLLLKAALKPSHPNYSSYLPTYYTSALVWSGAASLIASNFTTAATNITMTLGTNPGGTGFIGGSVLVGANKNTAVGDPLKNRILLLTNSSGQPVAYTYSDTVGHFRFSGLAFATYKIFGDAWGKTNPALTLTITAAKPSISTVIFEENNKTFKGHITALSIGASTALDAVSVYPNPVTEHVWLSGLSAISGSKTLVLSNITGAVISRQVVEQGGDASISTATLPAGIYMLQLQTAEGTAGFKIVK